MLRIPIRPSRRVRIRLQYTTCPQRAKASPCRRARGRSRNLGERSKDYRLEIVLAKGEKSTSRRGTVYGDGLRAFAILLVVATMAYRHLGVE